MVKEISWELREQAEELYIFEGQTHEEIAGITGVAIQTLKGWSADGEWSKNRREYRQQMSGLRRDTIRLRCGLLRQALNSLKPQDVYAFTNLEQMATRAAKEELPIMQAVDPKVIKTPEDAIDALQDLIERKLNIMLVQPFAIKPETIKEIKQAQELIDKMKEKYKAEIGKPEKSSGLSTAMAKEIREKILGVTA